MGFKENLKASIKKQAWLTKSLRNYRDGYLFVKSYKRSIKGKNNTLKISSSTRLVDCEIKITGNNNKIIIGSDSFFKNVKFFIHGNSNLINIDELVSFNKGGEIWLEDENCELAIGAKSTFEDVHLAVTESNSKISIGSDCMFSNDIDVRTGDSHAIFDNTTNNRINEAQNVKIDNHVWVGAHVSILKGASIASNSIVATRSLVTKKFKNIGIIIGGSPAIQIKENITWTRERIPD